VRAAHRPNPNTDDRRAERPGGRHSISPAIAVFLAACADIDAMSRD
jgi:hypothetical protein